jgi:Fe2+ transport system protein B
MGTGITILLVFIAVVVTLLIAVPVTRKIAVDNKIKQDAEKIGTAEEKARNIIDEALKTAETKKREALLEAKEESLRTKNEVEKETRERRAELQKYEKRVLSKEESVDKKADVLERRENDILLSPVQIHVEVCHILHLIFKLFFDSCVFWNHHAHIKILFRKVFRQRTYYIRQTACFDERYTL